ncbi:LuxR C-terminal-related transcriptional regulator [Microvirga massiliensis]|uniref:LuxR C-terminal-related transcriptional regulator n=1 Tax=Microvirga massiliensis TaxID=1033741 RepID=UPI00062BCC5C|nr:response regulator transcription factor [Microvirga massiliensis]
MAKAAIALVNQQPLLLRGVSAFFDTREDFTIVANSMSIADAVTITAKYNPNVILFDLDGSGKAIKAISEIAQQGRTRIVIFTPVTNVEAAVRALEAGAAAYVSSWNAPDELMSAIECVLRGQTFISPAIASKVIASLRAASQKKSAMNSKRLTVREDQIISLLLKGKTNREIASQLGLSERTIKHYMGLLMQKLDARNRLELALAAKTFQPQHAPVFN